MSQPLAYELCRAGWQPGRQRQRKKVVEVKWRLVGHQKADVRYNVINQFTPSAAELKAAKSFPKKRRTSSGTIL